MSKNIDIGGKIGNGRPPQANIRYILIPPPRLAELLTVFRRYAQNQMMKEAHKRSEKRARDYARFHVRVTREEYDQILLNAKSTSKSPAELMRLLAQGYEPVSTIDAQHIVKLLHLRGDLGRLGGLFKAWLFGDPRKPGPSARQVRMSLTEMDRLREQIKEVVELLRAGEPG